MTKCKIQKKIDTILKTENLTRYQQALLLEEMALSLRKKNKIEFIPLPPDVLRPFGLILHLLVKSNFPISTRLFRQQIAANIEGGNQQKIDRIIAKLKQAGVIEGYHAGSDSLYYLKIGVDEARD